MQINHVISRSKKMPVKQQSSTGEVVLQTRALEDDFSGLRVVDEEDLSSTAQYAAMALSPYLAEDKQTILENLCPRQYEPPVEVTTEENDGVVRPLVRYRTYKTF